jgi:hypothetical protein
MQCDNCKTPINDGVTKCPTCGAEYKRQESVVLGLLRFSGSICLLLSAFMYLKFHSAASATLFASLGIGWLLFVRVLSARAPYRWLGGAKVGQLQDLPNFNSDFCKKTIRIGALICVLTVVATAVILANSEPGNTRCPGWTQRQLHGWTVALVFCSLWTAWVSFIAIRWDWFYRRSVDRMMRRWENGGSVNPRDFQANQCFVFVTAVSVFFAAMTLLSMLSNCTTSSGKFTIGF